MSDNSSIFDPDHNSTLQRNNAYRSLISQDDGVLSAIAEALLWRLDASRAFIRYRKSELVLASLELTLIEPV